MENTQQDREDEVKKIFTNTAKSYEFIVNATTLGMDGMWKKRMLDILNNFLFYTPRNQPRNILDLACGTGILTFQLAEMYPEANIVGVDIMGEYLRVAIEKKSLDDFGRIRFIMHNADELETAGLDKLYGQFDLIISSYIPKYVDFPKLLHNCDKLLAPGGMILFHDFTHPRRWIYRAFYNTYWLGLSSLLHFYPAWKEMGKDLKKIIWRSEWVSQFFAVTGASLHYNHRTVEWQPFDIACICYAVKGH